MGRNFHKDKVFKSLKVFLPRLENRRVRMEQGTPRDGVTETTIPQITVFFWRCCLQGEWPKCEMSPVRGGCAALALKPGRNLQ